MRDDDEPLPRDVLEEVTQVDDDDDEEVEGEHPSVEHVQDASAAGL